MLVQPRRQTLPGALQHVELQAELSNFAGFYVKPDNGNRRHLLMKEGKLMAERRPGVENELVPIAANRFVMAGVPAKLETSLSRSLNFA